MLINRQIRLYEDALGNNADNVQLFSITRTARYEDATNAFHFLPNFNFDVCSFLLLLLFNLNINIISIQLMLAPPNPSSSPATVVTSDLASQFIVDSYHVNAPDIYMALYQFK